MNRIVALIGLCSSAFAFGGSQMVSVKVIDRQNDLDHYNYATPSHSSYAVRGATLSVVLPDHRIAVINCDSKYAWMGNRLTERTCRVPEADTFEVEFDKNKAKLKWTDSTEDGKAQSETYKVLGIFPPAVVTSISSTQAQ